MDNKQFNILLDARLKLILKVLGNKAKEYSSEEDRLHNFKVAGKMLSTTPEKALMGMVVKHLVSVLDLVNSENAIPKPMVDEKIGDVINYMILLEALMEERRESEKWA